MRIAAFMLLLGSTVTLGADESPDPTHPLVKERLQFLSTWHQQNWRARQVQTGREDLETILSVDPAKSRIVKTDGNGNFVGSLDLPEHKNWRAFHVTPQGVAELTFPVRLQWVDSDHAMNEKIQIRSLDVINLGTGSPATFIVTFSHGHASIGYRTFGTKETFRWRLKESEGRAETQSMLSGVDRDSLEYRDSIQVGEASMSVITGH